MTAKRLGVLGAASRQGTEGSSAEAAERQNGYRTVAVAAAAAVAVVVEDGNYWKTEGRKNDLSAEGVEVVAGEEG